MLLHLMRPDLRPPAQCLRAASNPDLSAAEKWPGAAGIFQVSFILGSGLLFFVSRTPGSSSTYDGYGSF